MNKIKIALVTALVVWALVSCGNKKENATDGATAPTETETSTSATEEDTVSIEIESNDQMQYSMKEIKVPVGKKVILTLRHVGKMPKEAMGHNWVLLKQGTDAKAFADEASKAVATDYIPTTAAKDNIIAHTKLLGGGQADRIEFTITEAGTYDFLCSYPAHFQAMNGKLIAE
ncbi:MAG: azurin [Flavobacteriaceae bacterium]|jgi:azurin|nr:azurin [Flavobacteriaceae bacterium]